MSMSDNKPWKNDWKDLLLIWIRLPGHKIKTLQIETDPRHIVIYDIFKSGPDKYFLLMMTYNTTLISIQSIYL